MSHIVYGSILGSIVPLYLLYRRSLHPLPRPVHWEGGNICDHIKGRETVGVNGVEGEEHQVAGHTAKAGEMPAMLKQGACILKRLQDGGRGLGEAAFYIWINRGPMRDHPLLPFIPSFHGLYSVSMGGEAGDVAGGYREGVYIKLDHLLRGYTAPTILDLKVGRRSYDETASPEKVAREIAKYPPQETLGFRLSGYKKYCQSSGKYVVADKKAGKRIPLDDIPITFRFLLSQNGTLNTKNVKSILQQLVSLREALMRQATVRFYSSSLLFIMEDAPPPLGGDGAGSPPCDPRVKLIDFAHVFHITEEGGRDENVLYGVNSIISILSQLTAI